MRDLAMNLGEGWLLQYLQRQFLTLRKCLGGRCHLRPSVGLQEQAVRIQTPYGGDELRALEHSWNSDMSD